ncbi:MAG: acetylserotonin O-methyltransferase [Actinomycetota bacterium]|nr:acetylserotonin O-methyltransferase [Actinomycetota bacterium]
MGPYVTAVSEDLSPEGIQQLGSAFRASKALLSAVELGVFTALADQPLDAAELAERTGIHPRGARDFFDALLALGMLVRTDGHYANTPEADFFLDRRKPSYIGGMAEMQSVSGYRLWSSLTQGLRSGAPQTDAKGDFNRLYEDQSRARRYLQAMTAGSLGSARVIAARFPWQRYQSILDVGTAQGCLPVQVALAHDHLRGGGFDLPAGQPIFEEYVRSFGLTDRLRFFPGDFLADPLPPADVLVLGNILCDLDLTQKSALLAKAHAALPVGGALIVYESIIDDERRHNASALLTSLAMILAKDGAFGFTGADCRRWMHEAGFVDTSVEPLEGPRSMVVGYKGA